MSNGILNKGIEPIRWLIVAGIAYTLATTIWVFFETPVSAPAQAPRTASETVPAEAAGNINWILGKHLFGEAGAERPAQQSSNEQVVQTRLPLELQSVFVALEQDHSAAIVAQRGKPGLRYKVGEDLPGNATLVEVHTDRIILRRAGVREELPFPKSSGDFRAVPQDDEPQFEDELTSELSDADVIEPDLLDDQDDLTAADALSADGLEDIDDYRERLAEDAEGTLADLGIEPADGGGYRIGDLAESPALRQTGLQPGDVILSVNGRPVGDINQDELEIDNIMAQGSARIEVQRGSRRFFITASIPNR